MAIEDNLDLLLEIPEVMRINIDAKRNQTIEKVDTLSLLYYPPHDKVFFRHDNFLYALDVNLPIFTNSRPSDYLMGKRYVIALPDSQKAFVFSKHVTARDHEQFEQIVNEYSKLLFANDGVEPEWIGDTVYASTELADEIHKSNFFANSVKIAAPEKTEAGKDDGKVGAEKPVSEIIGNYLAVGGTWLMTGIGKAGEILGQGIRNCRIC